MTLAQLQHQESVISLLLIFGILGVVYTLIYLYDTHKKPMATWKRRK